MLFLLEGCDVFVAVAVTIVWVCRGEFLFLSFYDLIVGCSFVRDRPDHGQDGDV